MLNLKYPNIIQDPADTFDTIRITKILLVRDEKSSAPQRTGKFSKTVISLKEL